MNAPARRDNALFFALLLRVVVAEAGKTFRPIPPAGASGQQSDPAVSGCRSAVTQALQGFGATGDRLFQHGMGIDQARRDQLMGSIRRRHPLSGGALPGALIKFLQNTIFNQVALFVGDTFGVKRF